MLAGLAEKVEVARDIDDAEEEGGDSLDSEFRKAAQLLSVQKAAQLLDVLKAAQPRRWPKTVSGSGARQGCAVSWARPR